MPDKNDQSPKKEKDSRKDAFLRQAQAIIVSQRQWSDETRLKLRVLADRLKLPPIVYEAAMAELADSKDSDSRTRWEIAYVAYLEKQFGKIPGDILTLKAERKAIDYGRKRFDLTGDNCERLIEQVAESMDKVRISETEALRHAKNEVKRLTTGLYDHDSELIEQVVTAVSDWGVDETRATQLMEMQLASNRTKRRSRRARTILVRGSLLLLGLASIAATILLGSIIAGIENREPEIAKKEKSDIVVLNSDYEALPAWWNQETQRYYLDSLKPILPTKLAQGLISARNEIRSESYQQLLDQIWQSEVITEPSALKQMSLEDVAFQNILIHWFVREPELRNSYQLFDKISTLLDERMAFDKDDGWLNRILNDAMRKIKLQRIQSRIVATAEESDRKSELLSAIVSANSEFRGMAKTEAAIVLQSMTDQWTLEQSEDLSDTIWRLWPTVRSESEFSIDSDLVEMLFSAVNGASAERRLATLRLRCSLAAVNDDFASANWDQICQQVSSEGNESHATGITLLMSMGSGAQADLLTEALLSGTERQDVEWADDPFRRGLQIAERLGIRLPIDQAQDRIRHVYIVEKLRRVSVAEEASETTIGSDVSELLRINSLAVCLIEDRWAYERFSDIVAADRPVPTDRSKGEFAFVDVKQVTEAEGDLELLEALEELHTELRRGSRLKRNDAVKLAKMLVQGIDESAIQAWRTPLASLAKSPEFLLALSDQLRLSPEYENRLGVRIAGWTELQVSDRFWNSIQLKKKTLEIMSRLAEDRTPQLERLRTELIASLGWRASAVERSSSQYDFSGRSLETAYERLLTDLAVDSFRLPESLDDRYSNVLLLQSTMNQRFAIRYALPDREKVLDASLQDVSPFRLKGFIDSERRFSRILLWKLNELEELQR